MTGGKWWAALAGFNLALCTVEIAAGIYIALLFNGMALVGSVYYAITVGR